MEEREGDLEAALERALEVFRQNLPAVVACVAREAVAGRLDAARLALDVLDNGTPEGQRLMLEALRAAREEAGA